MLLDYLKNTTPENSSDSNSVTQRNALRREAIEYVKSLQESRDIAWKMNDYRTVKNINEEMEFIIKWFMRFSLVYEQERKR